MSFTFKQYLTEGGLDDLAKGRGEPARTHYPKTNYKRFMDDWNEKMGGWVRKAEEDGHHVMKRKSLSSGETVYDMLTDNKDLISTLVIVGDDDTPSGDHTFNFYNQQDHHMDNKYRVLPERTVYDKTWHYRAMTGENLHHSDQRNNFTTERPRKNMASDRQRDGQTLQSIMSSSRKK